MRHWIGVYFSVPDSELKKNCKEAGLFWQWTETFILFFSLSVSCLMHFFFRYHALVFTVTGGILGGLYGMFFFLVLI
jgi:hypothetical protein